MKHNQQRISKGKGKKMSISGGGKLAITLDEIVDYAKNLDNKDEAERVELMCYRMLGRRMTQEAADKIAEIPQQFKKKRTPTIGKLIKIGTINDNGKKVKNKTIIPSVGTYNAEVKNQNNNYPAIPLGQRGQKQLEE